MESSKQPAGAGRYAVAHLILLAIAWERGASGLSGTPPSFCAHPCVINTGDIFERDLSSSELRGEAAWSVSQSFRYDRLGRLTTFQEKPGSTTTDVETSAYDQWGNRFVTQGATPGMGIPTAATAFDALNRMGPGYDGSGNLTSYSPVTLTYDAENRIVKAELSVNGTVTETTAYEYDGAGRRVKKTFTPASGSAVTTTFVYDASGELAAEYGGPSSAMSGVRYVLSDHMGTTRALIASDGSVDKRYDFKPFGEEIGSGVRGRSGKYSSPSYPGVGDGFNQKFTGKERDAETGLDYFLARYYSGAHGRYLSPDWSDPPTPVPYADLDDPQTLNLYAYVRNNPVGDFDPDGHCGILCLPIVVAVAPNLPRIAPLVQQLAPAAGALAVGVGSAIAGACGQGGGAACGACLYPSGYGPGGPIPNEPECETAGWAAVRGAQEHSERSRRCRLKGRDRRAGEQGQARVRPARRWGSEPPGQADEGRRNDLRREYGERFNACASDARRFEKSDESRYGHEGVAAHT